MWKTEMVEALKLAQNGDKGRVMKKYAALTGKSVQTLHRIAKQNGYDPGRKKRCDHGECRLTDEQIRLVAGLMHVTGRQNRGVIMTVEDALDMAEKNGIIDPGMISAERMQAILRERKINAKALRAPTPHTRLRSRCPNHVHVFDVSVCIQYYLKDGSGLRIIREDMYKNKWRNYGKVKEKLHRYVLTDHFSNTVAVKYYYCGGETETNLVDFLISVWGGGLHDKLPFHGVPEILLMDPGAANTSKAVIAWLERLGVDTKPSETHNPRRNGSAESMHRLVERHFEARLAIEPADSVEWLNEKAWSWAADFNGTRRHSRHRMTRTDCWMTIKSDDLRVLPPRDILGMLFGEPVFTRKVEGDYTITVKNIPYNLRHVPGLLPGRTRVEVILRPFDYPRIGVRYEGQEYLVEPIAKVDGGFLENAALIGEEFKSKPETVTQKTIKQIENDAYGPEETRKRGAKPYPGISSMAGLGDGVKVDYLARQGRPIEITGKLDEQFVPVMRFIQRLAKEIKITKDLNARIKERFGSHISVIEVDRIMDGVRDGAPIHELLEGGGNAKVAANAV